MATGRGAWELEENNCQKEQEKDPGNNKQVTLTSEGDGATNSGNWFQAYEGQEDQEELAWTHQGEVTNMMTFLTNLITSYDEMADRQEEITRYCPPWLQ